MPKFNQDYTLKQKESACFRLDISWISCKRDRSKREITLENMRIGLRLVVLASLGLVTLQWAAGAADQKPASPATEANKPSFKDDREKASYALGANVGSFIKRNNMDLDVDVLVNAMKEVLGGKESKLTDQQAAEAMRSYQMAARAKQGEKNKKEGEAFLAENK